MNPQFLQPTASSTCTNQIVLAHVFTLKEQSDDKSANNAENQTVLRTFPYQVVSAERKANQKRLAAQIQKCLPVKFYSKDLPLQQQLDEFSKLTNEKQKEFGDDYCYLKFEITNSVGCEHYICGCQLQCNTCKEYFGCRLCHDEEVYDHKFPRYDVQMVKCNFCQREQKFQSKCESCGSSFCSYACDICKMLDGMGEDLKPIYHCDGCGVCMVGVKANNTHCFGCKTCYRSQYYEGHKCKEIGDCCVCMDPLLRSIYSYRTLDCGHQIHIHCLQSMFQQGNCRCPVCKKSALSADQLQSEAEQIKNVLDRNIISAEFKFKCQILCNQCGQKKITYFNPLRLYLCPECGVANCEFIEAVDQTEVLSNPDAPRFVYNDNEDLTRLLLNKFGIDNQAIVSEIITNKEKHQTKIESIIMKWDISKDGDINNFTQQLQKASPTENINPLDQIIDENLLIQLAEQEEDEREPENEDENARE